jgi:hypothetical protein
MDRVAVLAIAYHNYGVELEHLNKENEALLSYKKALNFAIKNLGPEHYLVENFRNVYETACK